MEAGELLFFRFSFFVLICLDSNSSPSNQRLLLCHNQDTPPIPVQRFLPILGVLHDDLLAPLAGGPDEGGDQGLPQHGHGLHRVITSRGQSPVVFFKFGTFCRPFFGSRHCTYWFKAEGWTYFCRFVFVCFT